ncbi:DUF541 domain-containing protein [Novosphingobium sp. FSY-8]|uniref:DUF541 domain-containing protein n=1 Tax=Novosphingobium ovatum TaxID=1908523 RepID=A0ABW9XDZ5_9SPHN|nr:SIMPL domain-containing protein [Novosphingobium ovatum]NBC36762.1 DUF541 domain-containing protein [Novosphingobium ovatum]
MAKNKSQPDENTIKAAVRAARLAAKVSVANRLRRDVAWVVVAVIVAGGVALGGYLLGDALPRAKRSDRTVTVRGVAERDVMADQAVWTLSFSANAANLGAAQAQVDRNAAAIRAFFTSRGFADDALQTTGVNVARETENHQVRYVVRQRLTLRSTDIARVDDAVHHQFDLVRKGVFLEDGSKATFIYTRLNQIKPAMVAQATKDARAAAEQFARDSGSDLGGIRTASQGYFEVTARAGDSSEGWGDADTPFKKVRVVTTVSYILK